jgi:F-type H+-transporting ATPase subunit b
LRSNWGNHPADITVTTAYPLADAQRQRLDAGLQQLTGLALPVKYLQDSGLVAGIRITIGAWTLHANVRDDLQGLAEFAHDSW